MKLAAMLIIRTVLIAGLQLITAQEQLIGRIDGRVLDLFGDPIAGAGVIISTQGGLERRFVTDGRGRYEASGLAAGQYSISASHSGFHVAKSSVYLGPGRQVLVELGLRPGRLGQGEPDTIITRSERQ